MCNSFPQRITLGGRDIARTDAVAVAAHVLSAQKLITGPTTGEIGDTLDLALDRLVGLIGADTPANRELADELLAVAIEASHG